MVLFSTATKFPVGHLPALNFSGDIRTWQHDNHHKRRRVQIPRNCLVLFSLGCLVFVLLHNADERKVAVFLVIIEAIAYNELIRDRKAGVINLYLFLTRRSGLSSRVHKCTDFGFLFLGYR